MKISTPLAKALAWSRLLARPVRAIISEGGGAKSPKASLTFHLKGSGLPDRFEAVHDGNAANHVAKKYLPEQPLLICHELNSRLRIKNPLVPGDEAIRSLLLAYHNRTL